MLERRNIRRTRILKRATIILNDRSSPFGCIVRNLTNVGASVLVPSSVGIPDSFALSFDFCRSTRQCRVIWRVKNELGVQFY
jgi:PilZ domain